MSRRLGLSLFFLGIGPACASAGTDDLNAAFVATLGQPAPVVRHVADHAGGTPESIFDITLSLEPQFLVPLGGARYALLISETTRSMGAGGAPRNAVTVAYLDRIDGGWAVEHVWFEVGGLGFAGNQGREVKSFGGAPLYFATVGWSGNDTYSATIEVMALDPASPQALGEIKGAAVYPVGFPDASPMDCESTNYTATVGPPASRQNRFSVTYEGWTAPVGRMLPRHSFRLSADAVVSGTELVTGLKTPDCMR
jgi:hypothetical protein